MGGKHLSSNVLLSHLQFIKMRFQKQLLPSFYTSALHPDTISQDDAVKRADSTHSLVERTNIFRQFYEVILMHVPYHLNMKVGRQWTGLLTSQIT